MSDPRPIDLRPATREQVLPLFEAHHGYKSLGGALTYVFAVFEDGRPVAAFAWQPPPPGAAKSVCPEEPSAVLALSRMVAVPHGERRLRHISKPLRRQMRDLIDRTRWPVLVTYSDEGQGHTGHVYKCSGWQKTTRKQAQVHEDRSGRRASCYSAGKRNTRDLVRVKNTWLQRWEHRVCLVGEARTWMARGGWARVVIPGKVWANGSQAHRWVRAEGQMIETISCSANTREMRTEKETA